MKNNQPNIHAMYGQTKIECGLAKSKLTFLNRCKSYIKRFILVLFIVLGFFKVSDAQIWKPLGPWGGEVYGIAGDSSILFAFVINQNKDVRVFKSTNNGSYWSLTSIQIDNIVSNPIIVNARFSNLLGRIFIGIGIVQGGGSGDVNAKIITSLDQGINWQNINVTGNGPGGVMDGFPVATTVDGKFMGQGGNVTSVDGINFNFNPIVPRFTSLGRFNNRIIGFKQTNPYDSLFTSIDGLNWSFLSKLGFNSNGSEYYDEHFSKQRLFSLKNTLFIRNDNAPGSGPFLKSVDNGLTWSGTGAGLPTPSDGNSPYTILGKVLFTANASGIYRSIDSGTSWQGINTPSGLSINCMQGSSGRLFVGTTSGIYVSDNLGEDWVESSFGFQREDVFTFAGSGKNLFGITSNPNKKYSSSNGGGNWQLKGTLMPTVSKSEVLYKGDTILANLFIDNIVKTEYSINQGDDFLQNVFNSSTYDKFEVSVHNKSIYRLEVAFDGAVYFKNLMRSSTFGNSWDTVLRRIDICGKCHKLKSSGNSLYLVGGSNSGDVNLVNAFYSIDNGTTWDSLPVPPSLRGPELKDIAVKGDSIFIISKSATTMAYRSYDRGQSWTSIFNVGGGAIGATLYSILEKNGVLYLTSTNGLYKSLNWGNSWSGMNDNFPFKVPIIYNDMKIKADSLIVSVLDYGLWFTTLCSANASALNLSPCSGENIQLLGSGGINYTWTGPSSFTSTAGNPIIPNVTAANSGTYTVTVNTPGGCSLQKSVTIAVQPGAGNLTLSANTVCAGQTLNLVVTGGNGTYQWSGPRGFSSTLQNPNRDTLTASDSGFYSVKVTAANSCTSTKSVYVAVPYLPRARIDTSGLKLNPCAKDTVFLRVSYKLAGAGYQWFRNNAAISGATSPIYKATVNGQYHYVYTKGVCSSEYYDEKTITFSTFVQPRRPKLSVNPVPISCLQQFTIKSTATGNYIRKWFKNGIEIPGANSANYTTDQLATYHLQVDTGNTCLSKSAPFTVNLAGVQVFTSPQIHFASIRTLPGDTLRCAVEWVRNDPPNPNIQRVIILRQTDTANIYDSIGFVGNNITDTAFVDLASEPRTQPYFYKIQARAVCPSGGTYLTSPSSLHKTIHLQISKAPVGNIFNLLWTAYEGFTVSSYKIYRGLSQATTFLTTVAGNITAYTDAPPTDSVYFYRIEAVTSDVYFPWGRINATPPRVSKSNTRPTTQRTQEINSAVFPAMENPADNFMVYPNPHNQTFSIKGGKPGQKYQAVLRDMLGREIANWSVTGSQNAELQNQAAKGMYWLEIRGEGYKGGVRLVKE